MITGIFGAILIIITAFAGTMWTGLPWVYIRAIDVHADPAIATGGAGLAGAGFGFRHFVGSLI